MAEGQGSKDRWKAIAPTWSRMGVKEREHQRQLNPGREKGILEVRSGGDWGEGEMGRTGHRQVPAGDLFSQRERTPGSCIPPAPGRKPRFPAGPLRA